MSTAIIDTRGPLRLALACLAHGNDHQQARRVAAALEEAGIRLRDACGDVREADDVIDDLGTPHDFGAFGVGYERAAREYWHGDDGLDEVGNPISEAELDGAKSFRDVYDGLTIALEALTKNAGR